MQHIQQTAKDGKNSIILPNPYKIRLYLSRGYTHG